MIPLGCRTDRYTLCSGAAAQRFPGWSNCWPSFSRSKLIHGRSSGNHAIHQPWKKNHRPPLISQAVVTTADGDDAPALSILSPWRRLEPWSLHWAEALFRRESCTKRIRQYFKKEQSISRINQFSHPLNFEICTWEGASMAMFATHCQCVWYHNKFA